MKVAGPTGWRGVMNRSPQRSDFGLSPLADNVDSLTQRSHVRVSRINHGIGGGMRLNEESDLSLVSLAKFQNKFSRSRLSLTGTCSAALVYVAVLVAGLLLLHVHLRFEIRDLKMQQHALQTVNRDLERKASALESSSAYLGDLGRLKDFAVMKRQMEAISESEEAVIAPYLRIKYSAESVATDQQEQVRQLSAAQHSKTNNPFRRIANMALALAEDGR